MADKIVQEAYERVRSRFADEVWFTLPQRAITDAIYREIRLIDAERLNAKPATDTGQDTVKSAAA